VQAFNTTGDVLAIVFGRYLILARTAGGTSGEGVRLTYSQRMADAQATELPYLMVAGVLALLAIIIARASLPELGATTRRIAADQRKRLSLWKHRNLVFGCGAIAACVWAEISVGNLFINFASQPTVANITHEQAAFYLTFFWGGMMVGRFAGAFIMRAIPPEKVLAVAALGGVVASLVATLAHGPMAMYGLITVGLFTSIMFPTIYDLAIRGLGPLMEEGSGLLILSIAGGALVFINGKVADNFGIHWAFVITALCELYVLFYALWGSKPTQALPDERLAVGG
jgi:FHS family L-fucose permease-like MFS transporter